MDIAVGTECFHRRQPLIFIHRQNTVKSSEVAVGKELFALVRPEDTDTGIREFLDGRHHDLLLLLLRMSFTVIRVQRQDSDARSLDREVTAKGGIELGHFVDDAFCRHRRRHVAQRHVTSQGSHAHLLTDKDVETFLVLRDAALDKLLIAREVEAIDMHVFLVHRSHHEHVEQSVLEIGDGPVQALDGRTAGILRGHAKVDLHVLIEHRQQVEPSVLGL